MTELAQPEPDGGGKRTLVRRHTLTVRITHWINVLCVSLLLMSGLQIFNAHPALYWGNVSTFDKPILEMKADDSGDESIGVTKVLGLTINTNGLFGLSTDSQGQLAERAFPSWMTIPSYQDLATGRRWHFFFAWLLVINGLVYLVHSLASGHVRRDLAPGGCELRGIGHSIREHIRLRFPRGEEARRYNVLQKLTYLTVIFVVIPLLVLAGLAMSPGINAFAPEILTVLGGRQSARTIHFVCAMLLVLFVVVHVVMVLLSGVWNNLRSMITGRYAITEEVRHDKSAA